MSQSTLHWNGPEVERQIIQRLQSGLDRLNERIAQGARDQLYVGHGLLTGAMREATTHRAATVAGSVIQGSVGSFGISYSLAMHARYRHILNALDGIAGLAPQIVAAG